MNPNLNEFSSEAIKLNEFDFFLFVDQKRIGTMTKIQGNFKSANNMKIFSNYDNDNVLFSQNKKSSLKDLGKDYEKIYITHIPAVPLEYLEEEKKEKNELEIFLNEAMIKVENDVVKDNSLMEKCYLSGRRSAIIQFKNMAIRLKGCGNLNIGFNLEPVVDLGNDHLEIRGSQFKNTCLNEQYITSLVNKRLEEENLISGNYSVGFWKYGDFTEIGKEYKILNEAPLMDKYCGLFLTNGDKRVGNNFFSGLNLWFESMLCDEKYLDLIEQTYLNFETLSENLKAKNFKLEKKEITYNDFIMQNNFYERKKFEYSDFEKENLMFDFNQYLKKLVKNFSEEEKNTLKKTEESFTINISKGYENQIPEKFFSEVTGLMKNINENLKEKGHFQLIVSILSKMAFEMGRIKAIFKDMDLNWGTFDYHSNAHLDNFILLTNNSRKLYTAPVDFDLAFTRKMFIDINYKHISFDELILSERNILSVQLSGINMIPNIEVNVLNFFARSEKHKMLIENLKTVIIETIQLYFLKGYFDFKDESYKDLENEYSSGVNFMKYLLLANTLS